jgi:molecular chaperone GrpE
MALIGSGNDIFNEGWRMPDEVPTIDNLQPDQELVVQAAPDPTTEVIPEVELVVPAPAYGSIATEEHHESQPAPPIETKPGWLDNPSDGTVEAIATLGETLHRKLDDLRTLFDREIRAEATREKVVDRLHAELQEYKQDLLLNVLRPVFVDLIQLHDDIGKMAVASDGAEGEVRRLVEVMQGFQQGIEDILYRQGVEPYHHESDAFDPRRQRAIATVPTDDPALNKTIAARHRKGFHATGGQKVIRPEIVSVYALKKS